MDNQVFMRLRQDHDNLRALLQALQQQLECVEANTNPDFALMEDSRGHLVRNPDQYHDPLRSSSCNGWSRAAPMPSRWFLKSTANANARRAKAQNCSAEVDEITVGIPVPRDHLLRTAHAYVRLYRSHLDGEERDLFPVLDESPTATDWMEITTVFQWTPDPAFTPENAAHYRDLRDESSVSSSSTYRSQAGVLPSVRTVTWSIDHGRRARHHPCHPPPAIVSSGCDGPRPVTSSI